MRSAITPSTLPSVRRAQLRRRPPIATLSYSRNWWWPLLLAWRNARMALFARYKELIDGEYNKRRTLAEKSAKC